MQGDRDLFKVANGWDVFLKIEFPSSFGPNLAAAALKRESFSSDLVGVMASHEP